MNRSKIFLTLMILALLGTLMSGVALAQRIQFTAPILVVNTSFLNVRTGPGAQYNVLLTVVGGTELPVLAVASDGVWYQVSTINGVGWVNNEFTVARGDFSNVPVIRLSDIDPPVPPTLFGIMGVPTAAAPMPMANSASMSPFGASCITTTLTLIPEVTNISAEPSQLAPVLGLLFNQGPTSDYPVLGLANNEGITWVKILVPELSNASGWMSASAGRFRVSGALGLTVVEILEATSIQSPPYSPANPLNISAGQEAWVTGDGGVFWNIMLEGGQTTQIQKAKTRIRTELTSDRIPDQVGCTPMGGSPVASNADLGQGGGGDAMMAPTPIPVSSAPARVVINTGFLNVRSGPGAQYSVVTTLAGGTEAAAIGITPDTEWYLIAGPWGQGWADSEFVVFRGVIEMVSVIRYDAVQTASLARPLAVIAAPVVLYAAPGNNFGTIGTVNAPAQAEIVAQSRDGRWLQINTSLGFGWVLIDQVQVRGDLALVPVVG
jgi:uncharacterized protein YraI